MYSCMLFLWGCLMNWHLSSKISDSQMSINWMYYLYPVIPKAKLYYTQIQYIQINYFFQVWRNVVVLTVDFFFPLFVALIGIAFYSIRFLWVYAWKNTWIFVSCQIMDMLNWLNKVIWRFFFMMMKMIFYLNCSNL